MHKNKIVRATRSFIFTKKLGDNVKIIPLNKTENTLGPMRYFPPANQEWFNSIYVYNNTYAKNITILDKNLSKLIKSYFNFFFKDRIIYNKHILTRFRRLAINRIFVNKAELKHTSSKVIITLYVYNEERRALINRIKRIEGVLFPSIKFTSTNFYKKQKLSFFDKLNIMKKYNFFSLSLLEEIKKHIIEIIDLEKKVLETINKSNLKSKKLQEIETLEENVKNILAIVTTCKKDPFLLKRYDNIYKEFLNKTILEKEIITITYLKLLLSLNKSKFEDKFIFKLKPLVSEIYNKEVEFNIVNLKAIYLNSDIFTQAISLKLRNRSNRLLTVLRYFLYMVKLSNTNILKEQFNYIDIKNIWVNKVKNLALGSSDFDMEKDSINQLLTSVFSDSSFLRKLTGKEPYKNCSKIMFNQSNDLVNYIFNTLKYKSVGGVRLETKGRLTRRFTASRSVFKIK